MVYEQFGRAFGAITAYALIRDGEAVGRVAIKYGAAVTAYVQIWGVEMAKGQARGGGYDRASAAVYAAIGRLPANAALGAIRDAAATAAYMASVGQRRSSAALGAIRDAAATAGSGERWTTALERGGFSLALVIG